MREALVKSIAIIGLAKVSAASDLFSLLLCPEGAAGEQTGRASLGAARVAGARGKLLDTWSCIQRTGGVSLRSLRTPAAAPTSRIARWAEARQARQSTGSAGLTARGINPMDDEAPRREARAS